MKTKKQTYMILVFVLYIFCFNLNAQVKTKVFYTDIPMRFKSQMKAISKTYKIETPTEFHSRKQKNLTEETQFAIPTKVNIDFLKEAIVEEDELIRTYSLNLEAKDALNVSLQFSEFHLPENVILSIYTQNELTDSITSSQNNINNIWATKVYQGSRLSIVLKMPRSSQEKIALKIGAVNFGYKRFGVQFDFGNIGASAPCHINANCPLGDNWNNEKNSVALIVANGIERCTGSLIMNACNTNIPYFLTADHCLDAGNVPNWVFQFQTWSTDCATNIGWREDIQFNGCQLRANNAATDFALLELNTTPPANSGLFYSGWSRNIVGNTSTTVLHHPMGDLMKISVDNQAPIPAIRMPVGVGDVWQIDQDFGRLEGGSSGAPYYNQNHQIIGQHWGRPDAGTRPVCDITIAQGGRFDLSWTGGGTNATRLSNWLDPNNLGSMTTNTTSINNLLNVRNPTNQIMGSSNICNVGSTSGYSMNLPNGYTVTWSATGSVSINQTTGLATAIANGQGTITAVVSGGPCGNVQFTKTVRVGLPSLINSVSFFNGIGEEFYFCTSHIGNYMTFEPFDSDATYRYRVLSWPNLQVLYTSPSTYNSNQIPVNWVPFPNPAPYFYVIEIQATNACGSTDWTGQGGWEVEFLDCSSPGGGWFLMSYPNPSNEELIVEAALSENLEGTSTSISQNKSNTSGKSLVDLEAALELLNEAQEVVWQGSLKAGRASINTSSLPEGTYYLRLTHEGETLTRRVWVRH